MGNHSLFIMSYQKKIMSIALPAMGEAVLQQLMGIVDAYLVAQISLVAVSGVSIANNLLAVYQALFLALGAAISSLLASQKREKDQALAIRQGLSLTFWLSLGLGSLSLVLGPFLLKLLGASGATLVEGGHYMMVVGGGIFALAYFSTFSAMLRVKGDNQFPMVISLLTNGLNVLLAGLMVFGFHFGVLGVGLATVLSRLLCCMILYRRLKISSRQLVPTRHLGRELWQLALPTAGERLMMRLGDVMVMTLIIGLGSKVVAGNAIGETLIQLNHVPALGIATATIILVAQAKSENRIDEIRDIISLSYRYALVMMLVMSGSVFAFGIPLTRLFTLDHAALTASLVVLTYAFLGTPATVGTLIYTAACQGLGEAKLPFYATSLGMWGIRLGVGLILTSYLGLSAVWIATILDNVFRFVYLRVQVKRLLTTLISS